LAAVQTACVAKQVDILCRLQEAIEAEGKHAINFSKINAQNAYWPPLNTY